jgi:iron complex outermembrane receptor protein
MTPGFEPGANAPVRDNAAGRIGVRLVLGIILPMMAIGAAVPSDLTEASLDQLMNIQVTSVSKKEQKLSKASSSIYVITQEDIRHSGATNVPDLLRMVPGVEVARINANTWAISIRGFNLRYSTKVLVLVDGRTVYTPGFSGVYWDQQTMPLENIDRIEVIRGPGGTVWGANAMNGVINILTKSAKETHGGLISAVTGTEDRAQGMEQYGGTAGTTGSWRVYGRYAMNANSPSIPGSPAVDDSHASQMGFRTDWDLSPRDKLTVQGDALGTSEGQTISTLFDNRLPDLYTIDDQVRVNAENVLGRWSHVFSNASETTVQVYYDRFRRFDQGLNDVNTGDVEFQYHFQAGPRNDIVAGGGYRVTAQTYGEGYEITFGTGYRKDDLFSGFIQDQINLTDSLAVTAGIKVEHNEYTGYEYEPSVQLAWSPTAHQTLWVSAAKAIQQPSWLVTESQLDTATVSIPGAGLGVVHLGGNPQDLAPRVFDYEVGYRAEVSKRLTLDGTVFVADYDRLNTLEPQPPYFTPTPAPPHLVIPTIWGNYGTARNYGVEFSAHWNVTKWWRISPGYSFLEMNLSLDPRSQDTGYFLSTPGDSPKHQGQLRSNIKLPHNLEWDTSAYYVGLLAGVTTGPGISPAYTRLDTRLGWRVGEYTEIGLTGQNLLSPRHVEFMDGLQVVPMEAARALVAKITWHF